MRYLLSPFYGVWGKLWLEKLKELVKELKTSRLSIQTPQKVKLKIFLFFTTLSCPQQITYVTLKTTEQINNQMLQAIEEAEVWHCKVFMETLMDNSDLSSLIKYKYVSVLCFALSLPCSLTLSHTYPYSLPSSRGNARLTQIEDLSSK